MGLDSEIHLASRDGEFSVSSKRPEHLLNLRSAVDFDGGAAIFDLAFTNQHPFRLEVPFSGMPAIFSEIRHAQSLMITRQRRTLDRGAQKLLELCEMALRPIHLETLVDPRNGDRLFIHQFDTHAPIAFRVSPVELAANLETIHRTLYQITN